MARSCLPALGITHYIRRVKNELFNSGFLVSPGEQRRKEYDFVVYRTQASALSNALTLAMRSY